MYTSSPKLEDRNKQTISSSSMHYQSDSAELATPQIIWNLGENMRSEKCWSYRCKGLLNIYKTFQMLQGKSLVKIQTRAMKYRSEPWLHNVLWRTCEHLKSLKSFVPVYFHFMTLPNICQQQISPSNHLLAPRKLKIDSTRNTAVGQ